MDTISIIRGLYQAHLSECSDDPTDRQELMDKFNSIMDKYVRECLPNAVFDGEIPDLLFDESDDGWYGVDAANDTDSGDGPVAYRVIEKPGKNTCEVCIFIDGKTLPIDLLEQGVTAPPFHPNCRGWVEVLDRDGNVLFVIGRDEGEESTIWIDKIQMFLDVLGIVSPASHGLNGIISLVRGNTADAVASFGSMIPFAAWTETGAEWMKNIIKHGSFVDDVVGLVAKYGGLSDAIIAGAESITDAIKDGIDTVAAYGGELMDFIFGVASDIIDGVANIGDEILDGLGKVAEDVAQGVGENLKPQNLIDELAQSGAKHNADDIVMIIKTPDGKIMWLEMGNSSSGLTHITQGHAENFADKGIFDIPSFLYQVLQGNPVNSGMGVGGPFAEYLVDGTLYRVAYGTNGFIVSFYPIS